jgi:hypothetical protein
MASRPDFYLVKNGFKIAIWSILKSPYLIIWSILENFLVDWHFFYLATVLTIVRRTASKSNIVKDGLIIFLSWTWILASHKKYSKPFH